MSAKPALMDRMLKVKCLAYVAPSRASRSVGEICARANREFAFAADPIVVHSTATRSTCIGSAVTEVLGEWQPETCEPASPLLAKV